MFRAGRKTTDSFTHCLDSELSYDTIRWERRSETVTSFRISAYMLVSCRLRHGLSLMSITRCCSIGAWNFTFTCLIFQVSKIAVKSCDIYTDCESCVTTLDPLRCGWCDDRCTTEAQCVADWSNRRCPPVIYSVRNLTYVVESRLKLWSQLRYDRSTAYDSATE